MTIGGSSRAIQIRDRAERAGQHNRSPNWRAWIADGEVIVRSTFPVRDVGLSGPSKAGINLELAV
jgi:hypothetical protein